MSILALDFETGGLDPKTCAPVSLGLAVMDGVDVIASCEFRFGLEPFCVYEDAAMKIHGLTRDDLANEPRHAEVYRLVKEWLNAQGANDLTVISHNALFDQGFWAQWLYRIGRRMDADDPKSFRVAPELLSGAWACTKRMASNWLDLPDNKLDTVAAQFGLSREGGQHGALEDAILAGRIFHAITSSRELVRK